MQQMEIAHTQSWQNSLKVSNMLHGIYVEQNDVSKLLEALVDQKPAKDLRPGLRHPPSRICGGGCLISRGICFAPRFSRIPAI